MKQTFTRLFGLSGKEEHEVEQVVEQVVNNNHVQQIPLDRIIPNRYQPRTVFVDERIAELASTIHTHGIIQPIIIRKCEENKYEIIAGERRFRAVTSLGWETIPAIVKEMNDTEVASVALIENLQREELTAIEEAMAYEKLIQLHELTQEALAQRLGKGQSTVANKLRLLKLPQAVQHALLHKKITERHARALIPLKDPEQQVKVLEQIIERKLNVKQTEDCVVKLLEQKTQRPKPRRKSVSKDTRIALNTIRESLAMVSSTGLPIDSNEEEHEDYYQITIKIPKK